MRNTLRRFEIRKNRVRSTISKRSDRVRLSVFKSSRHLYAQIIDDVRGVTLASASTIESDIRKKNKSQANNNNAQIIGELIGKRAKEAGVTAVVFDKGGYKYHGVLKTLADAARNHVEF